MNSNYPIMLRLEGKRVVVVGGGNVAERKVTGLLGTGARLTIISPEAASMIQRLAYEGKIEWLRRSFSNGDIDGAFMIFAATNDPELNRKVKESAGPNQLVSLADDPEDSDFHLPSRLQRGRLNIMVSTGGASPTLAKKIRGQLEEQFDESYEEYLEFLFLKRQWILQNVEDASLKRKLLTELVSPSFLNSENRENDFQQLYNEHT